MSKYNLTASEIRKLVNENEKLKEAEFLQGKINKDLKKRKVNSRLEALYAASARDVTKDELRMRIKHFADLDLMYFDKKDEPEDYHESVKILQHAIQSVKSPYQKFIEDSNLDYYNIAENAYVMAANFINEEEEKVGGVELKKYTTVKPGEVIPVENLVVAIESVTDNAIQIGIQNRKRKRPFFFHQMPVAEKVKLAELAEV